MRLSGMLPSVKCVSVKIWRFSAIFAVITICSTGENGRVLAVRAHAQVHGDALALAENLDAADGQPRFDLGAREAIGDAVVMSVDLDVIIDADAAQAPFAVFVRLARQGLQCGAVDLFKQMTAGDAETAKGALLVESLQHLADRGVELRQAVKDPA